MVVEDIKLENGNAVGLKFELQNTPLVLVKAERGFVMCGYLNMDVADRVGDIACKVSGVSNIEDLLNAEIIEMTEKAKDIGIQPGMQGREALERMF